MKKQDRWNEILNIIKIKKEVTVEELAEEFNTSLATIRRDLLEMEENSMITRPSPVGEMKESCFSAVMPVIGWNQWV